MPNAIIISSIRYWLIFKDRLLFMQESLSVCFINSHPTLNDGRFAVRHGLLCGGAAVCVGFG